MIGWQEDILERLVLRPSEMGSTPICGSIKRDYFMKNYLHLILFGILVLTVVGIIGNSIKEGVDRIVTQNMIDDTYRIHK